VPRNDANQCWFFLDSKTIRHCERGTIEHSFVIEYPKGDCFVPRKDVNLNCFFLNRKTICHCERGTIEQSFVIEYPMMRLLRASQ
jgi:hypothetical protein